MAKNMVNVEEILNQIEEFDQENQFQRIVDFILSLDDKYRTDEVNSELARAYNNIYWENKCPENLHYLQKSVDILLALEQGIDDEERSNWHYRIGYAYYFLENIEQASYHLSQAVDIANSEDLLRQLHWMDAHQISAVDASVNHTRYLMQDFFAFLSLHYPEIKASLNAGVNQVLLDNLAKRLESRLPSPLSQFYQAMNGQHQHDILQKYLDVDMQYFVAIDEIDKVQQTWQQRLEQVLGHNWVDVDVNNLEMFPCAEWVKPTLFNSKWVPVIVGDEQIYCVDLDPIHEEDFGQIICIWFNEAEAKVSVYYRFSALQDLIGMIFQELAYLLDEQNQLLDVEEIPTHFS